MKFSIQIELRSSFNKQQRLIRIWEDNILLELILYKEISQNPLISSLIQLQISKIIIKKQHNKVIIFHILMEKNTLRYMNKSQYQQQFGNFLDQIMNQLQLIVDFIIIMQLFINVNLIVCNAQMKPHVLNGVAIMMQILLNFHKKSVQLTNIMIMILIDVWIAHYLVQLVHLKQIVKHANLLKLNLIQDDKLNQDEDSYQCFDCPIECNQFLSSSSCVKCLVTNNIKLKNQQFIFIDGYYPISGTSKI
ncbi:unnamed protein product [Paramecium pentaurelia]|uniref:Uncharacterized protein n=1 Tax=Paramecium pentaurelia TaxID=43138 RepID=A0A8S1YP87_9CILI|nr:unnamed protein product [Paramecium pentaurelia]